MGGFDILISLIVVFALLRGYTSGFVMQIAYLVGIVGGAFFAGKLATIIINNINIDDLYIHIAKPATYSMSFLIIIIIITFTGSLLTRTLKIVKLNTLNRIAGSLFCAFKYVFIISLLINLIAQFDIENKIIPEETKTNSRWYIPVKNTAQKVIPFFKNIDISEKVL